jgi:histidine ammonia-lyase
MTSGLQEDFLSHPTAAANKLLAILDNAETVLAIELMAGAQAQDFRVSADYDKAPAPGTRAIRDLVRSRVARYEDDRPLHRDMEALRDLIAREDAPSV